MPDDHLNSIEVLEKALARHLEWIRAADTKLSILLPIDTAMLGAISIKLPDALSQKLWCQVGVAGICVILLLISLVFVAWSFFPRVHGPAGKSYIYFGVVASNSLREFKNDIESISTSEYKDDLIRQCYINAWIAKEKYGFMRRSTMFMFAAFPFWIVALLLLFGIQTA